MAGLSRKMKVCIVDAYSSGRYLSACLLRRGHPCVHVQSDSSIPPLLLEGFPKQDFDAGFIHEGDLDRTAEFLKSQNVGSAIVGCETGVEQAANAFPPGYDWVEGLFPETPKNPKIQAEKDAATVDACLGSAAGQRVLICPSGDGRLALHLARSGALVTCVDINRRSLQEVEDQFRALGLTGAFYKMDIRFLPFREEFDMVIVWFNSFGYFPGVDDLASMESLSRALLPKGRLLLESPVLSTIGLRLREDSFRRKAAIQWNERSRIVSGFLSAQRENEKRKIPFRFRIYSEGEYRAMMRSTGVSLERVFTDSRPLFGSGLERLILLGRKG